MRRGLTRYLTREDRALRILREYIEGKTVLEAACGRASFALRASDIAREVWCSDIKDTLLLPEVRESADIRFDIADASNMCCESGFFDTVILYNAIGHLEEIVPAVMGECRRVVKVGGHVAIISSSKMDKRVIGEILVPWLDGAGISYERKTDRNFEWIVL